MGIKNIIKFGDNICCISDEEIEDMLMVETASKNRSNNFSNTNRSRCYDCKGFFSRKYRKSLLTTFQKRVGVLLSFLGSVRRITIPEKDLIF